MMVQSHLDPHPISRLRISSLPGAAQLSATPQQHSKFLDDERVGLPGLIEPARGVSVVVFEDEVTINLASFIKLIATGSASGTRPDSN